MWQGKSGVRAKMEHGAALREMTPSDTDDTQHQEFRSVRRRSPPANIIMCKIDADSMHCARGLFGDNIRFNQFCRDCRRYRMVHVV